MKKEEMKELKRYFSYMGRYKYMYWFIITVTLIVESGLQILYSFINKRALNAVEYQNMAMFRETLCLCAVVVLLKCLFPYLRYFQIKLVRKMVFEFKIKLFNKLMRLDMEFYEKSHSGEALKTLNWDANSLKDSWFSHVYWVLGKITLGISSLIAMFIYSPLLTMISAFICIITMLLSLWMNNKIKDSAGKVQKSTTSLVKYLSDILSAFSILKMYSGSCIIYENYKCENRKAANQENKRVQKASALETISFLLGILGSFGIIAAGTYLAAKNQIDYGTVMAIVTLQMSLSNNMQKMCASVSAFTTSLVKAKRVFDFFELECEEQNQGGCLDINMNMNPITITNLSFAYGDNEKVFQMLNMDIKANESVAVMGESGCGKSTLLKLLLRFYPVENGQAAIFGKDINTIGTEQLRNLITYVPQESYLFEGTIAQNIAFGNSQNCSMENIKAAAAMAYADEFIEQLKNGYDTHVDSGGTNLSGGQRQRIAIARAFLKNSPIYLFDEPSSALDSNSEQAVQKAVTRLMKNKTILMVTHRNSGISGFDRVVKLLHRPGRALL